MKVAGMIFRATCIRDTDARIEEVTAWPGPGEQEWRVRAIYQCGHIQERGTTDLPTVVYDTDGSRHTLVRSIRR